MPMLHNAFCCTTLKTGTIIVGWLGSAHIVWKVVEWIIKVMQLGETFYSVSGLLITLFGFMQLGIHLGLIKGGKTKSQKLLLPWLGVAVIELIGMNAAYMHLLYIGAQWELVAGIIVVVNVIGIYMWLIVFSYYQELQYSKKQDMKEKMF